MNRQEFAKLAVAGTAVLGLTIATLAAPSALAAGGVSSNTSANSAQAARRAVVGQIDRINTTVGTPVSVTAVALDSNGERMATGVTVIGALPEGVTWHAATLTLTASAETPIDLQVIRFQVTDGETTALFEMTIRVVQKEAEATSAPASPAPETSPTAENKAPVDEPAPAATAKVTHEPDTPGGTTLPVAPDQPEPSQQATVAITAPTAAAPTAQPSVSPAQPTAGATQPGGKQPGGKQLAKTGTTALPLAATAIASMLAGASLVARRRRES
ncbi:MAG: LPXTG cell wall anchor domain-containing protein [Buchananella hordeovulneris]|nr:LPXTG cell wall anchor domain-containing protein [Buchananella hordeovulneris]